MTWRLWLLVGALAGVAAVVISVLITARRVGVVPMPSSENVRRLIAHILENQTEYAAITDLGSGWGGLARRIASRLPDKHVCAVEHGWVADTFSRLLSPSWKFRNLTHYRADLHDLPLRDNQIYVCFLSREAMKKLRTSYERDLPRNGLLVSAVFSMPGWTPSAVHTAGDIYRSPVYVYEY